MGALKRGDAARSGLIFRGSMLTSAQLLRGEEDYEVTKKEHVPPRKLFSPRNNLLNHLNGSDATHGALLEFTVDMADIAAGLTPFDGTAFHKHGMSPTLLSDTLALPMNAGHRDRHARQAAKNVAASTPQPIPDGPVPPGIAKLAAELRRSKDDGIGSCADSSTSSTFENVIHTVVANGVPPRLILEADEAARAAASLPAEAAPSLPSRCASPSPSVHRLDAACTLTCSPLFMGVAQHCHHAGRTPCECADRSWPRRIHDHRHLAAHAAAGGQRPEQGAKTRTPFYKRRPST